MRRRTRWGTAASLAVSILLAGCGGESSTVTQTESTATESIPTSPASTSPTDPLGGPTGDLLADGIGDIGQGASPSEVEAAFGEPASKDQFPGCELNPDASPVVQFACELPGGGLTINFDARSNELTSYRVDSPELETSLGDSVGEQFGQLQSNWGGSLQPLVLGSEQPSTKTGVWVVTDGQKSQLLFSIEGSKIDAIQGGYLPPCE